MSTSKSTGNWSNWTDLSGAGGVFQVVAGRVLGALRGAILLRSDLVGPMGDTQLLNWRQQTLWSIISACSETAGRSLLGGISPVLWARRAARCYP